MLKFGALPFWWGFFLYKGVKRVLDKHEKWMAIAIKEARKGRGKTYKNPLVGAVIVKADRLIGKGYHASYGDVHAEVNAFQNVSNPEETKHSSIYVTLEPCSHHGKQPPCCEKIVEMGIEHVYVAQLDSNPLVRGKGVAYLEAHGIKVTIGVLEKEADQLNPAFHFFHRHRRPLVTLKQAVTIDGKTNSSAASRTYLTDEKTSEDVQQLRMGSQAILVGSETVLIDDPALTIRSNVVPYPPLRIVLDRRGRTVDQKFQLWRDGLAETWLFTGNEPDINFPEHVRVFVDPDWTIEKVIRILAEEGIQSLCIEGGAAIHDAFLAAGKVDRIVSYVAPYLLGGNARPAVASKRQTDALTAFELSHVEQLKEDVKLVYHRREADKCLPESSERSVRSLR